MTDFYSEAEPLKLAPEKEHRIRAKRALKTLVHLDDKPHDLIEAIFPKEEIEWLRQNLRT
jgi:hypothetical protein